MKTDVFHGITSFIGKMVVNHPGKITLFFLITTALLFIPVTWMDTSTSMSDFTPDSRFVKADEMLRRDFNTTDKVTCILDAGSGSVLSREGLLHLIDMESEIRTDESISPYLIDYEDPILSIADPVGAALDSVTNGSYGIHNVSDKLLLGIIRKVLDHPEYSKLVSSDDNNRYGVILIKLRHDLIERGDESVEVRINDRIEGMDLGDFDYFSPSALNDQMKEDAISSLSILLPISVVMVIIILAVGLRSVPKVIASLIGIGSAVIMSFGIFSLLGLLFSQMMFFAPIVIIVLCIDYGIHLLFRDREFLRNGEPPSLSMKNAVRFMGISISLSTVTTALAFGSNGLSAIPAVSSFGIFLAMGILISFVVMMFFVPSMVLLYRRYFNGEGPDFESKDDRGTGRLTNRISETAVSVYSKVPWLFILAAVLIAGSGLYFGLQIDKDMSAEDVTAEGSPIVKSINVLRDDFPGLGGETCYVIVKGDISDPGVLEDINGAIINMMDDEHISDAGGSVKSIIPALKQLYNASDPTGDGLPESKDEIRSLFEVLYDQGIQDRLPPESSRSMLSRSKEGEFVGTAIILSAVNVSGPGGGDLLNELEKDLESLESREGVEIMYAGFVFERYDMLDQMIDGLTTSTFITTLLVMIIVILLFRSFRYGIITTIPVILVIGWIMGLMSITRYQWNMVTVTITSMTVGVGIDYSIHLVERYRQERENSVEIRKAMSKALATTGGSLFAAAATTFGGFFVMSFSTIGMYNAFGVLVSLMILFAFLAAVLVLPPAILWIDRIQK